MKEIIKKNIIKYAKQGSCVGISCDECVFQVLDYRIEEFINIPDCRHIDPTDKRIKKLMRIITREEKLERILK